MHESTDVDVAVIGAGAAGLATAIFVRRSAPALRVAVFDGARTPGAKILVSGGSRCNVTNVVVTERDFNGGHPGAIRRVLRAFPPDATVRLFAELGVALHEEAGGKLFPDSNRSRDVLDALLSGVSRGGAELRPAHRIESLICRADEGFDLHTSHGVVSSRAVVLATGGLSLPKTGSDGGGYRLALSLGHQLVPTTPALVPLCFDTASIGAWHAPLSGVALPARLTIRAAGTPDTQASGAMLWTHFGISGPATLDVSRHWLRARLEGRAPTLSASLLPDERFEALEEHWLGLSRSNPRQMVQTALSAWFPATVASALAARARVPGTRTLSELTRVERRSLVHSQLDAQLPVTESRGYNYAEVTAGGVNLDEINPATMESRVTPGLFLVGEILDVDGRIGGFNFQWAWSSAYVAGKAIAGRHAATRS